MKKRINFCLTFVVIALSAVSVFSQSATADTLDEKSVYVEGNFWTATQSHANGGMQIYGGRVAYGVTKRVEIGLGASFSNPHDVEYPPELQPSLKVKVIDNDKYGVKVSGGVLGFIPVARKAGTDGFAMVYANVSKSVKKMNDATITIGGYSLAGRTTNFGNRKGWNIVYDQPINERLAFSTQWVTGKNRFGYLTPGFSIAMPKSSSLFVGYSIGNYDYDNHGPFISYSFSK